MAVTVATLLTDVKDRLIAGSTGGEASDTMISRWIRMGYQEAIGQLSVVRETSVVVSGTDGERSGSLVTGTDRVHYVKARFAMLYPNEWRKEGDTLLVDPSACGNGDAVTVWYTPAIAIDIASTTTIDTDSIFGDDWLSEIAVAHAIMQVYQRYGGLSITEGGGDAQISNYRVLQQERGALYEGKRNALMVWHQERQEEWKFRPSTGDLAMQDHAYAHFDNASAIVNPLTQRRTRG